MTDTLGALSVPVSPAQTPIGDPLRQKLGAFLQAAIRAGCQSAWSELAGNSNVVERVETNDPNDNTFHTSKLPCLALLRGQRGRKPVQFAADVRYRESQVIALWIPPTAVQAHRANRESFFQAIEASVDKVVYVGRTPGWVAAGDTDPAAVAEGSHIDTQLGLLRPIRFGVEFEDSAVEIEMMGGAPSRVYPALKITFNLWEPWDITPATYPAAVDINVSNQFEEETGTVEDLP